MSKTRKGNINKDQEDIAIGTDHPRCLALAEKGIKTGTDFANLMSALISDIVSGRINPLVANATCKAGNNLLKIVEMQYRYGKSADPKALNLAPGESPESHVN